MTYLDQQTLSLIRSDWRHRALAACARQPMLAPLVPVLWLVAAAAWGSVL